MSIEPNNPLSLITELLEQPDAELRSKISAQAGNSRDEKHYPDQEQLARMREHDEFTLVQEKRDIAKFLLRWTSRIFVFIAILFVLASVIWLVAVITDPNWISSRLTFQEVLKTGWTVALTMIATRFSEIVFNDKAS